MSKKLWSHNGFAARWYFDQPRRWPAPVEKPRLALPVHPRLLEQQRAARLGLVLLTVALLLSVAIWLLN